MIGRPSGPLTNWMSASPSSGRGLRRTTAATWSSGACSAGSIGVQSTSGTSAMDRATIPVEPKTSVTRAPVAVSKRGARSLNANARSAAANSVSDGGSAATLEPGGRASHARATPRSSGRRITPHILQSAPLRGAALLGHGQRPVHEEDDDEQEDRERERHL